MTIDEIEKITNSIFRIMASIAIFIAGIWAVFEYVEHKENQRIIRTQEYIERMVQGKPEESIQYLVDFWAKFDWKGHKDRDKKVVISEITSDPIYQRNLINVLNFLENVQNCVSENRCKLSMVKRGLSSLYENAFINHYQFILNRRELSGRDTYFRDLECFVRKNIRDFEPAIVCG